jgi:shikimate dehydrogenase
MNPPRAFVIGHPIAHSRSPMLHGYWLKRYGIAGSYEAVDVAPDALGAFFAGFRDAGWAGGNVTVPHKTAVIPHLQEIDAAARAIGAVNTIWWEGDALVGGNTDAAGLLGNLDELAPGWDREGKRAVILGAGGAARAAVYGLRSRGFDVAVCNRTRANAEALAGHFGRGVSGHGMDDLPSLLRDADLLVNTTSLGMKGQPPLDIDLAPLPARAIVNDIVYVPLETELLRAAKARGNRTVEGLGMLLHQAVEGFLHWFGHRPEVTAELRALIAGDIRAKTGS